MTKCCLCGQEFEGFGNNPWPLNNDENARCCDKCNAEKVIPARIMQAYSKKEDIKEGEYSDIYGEEVDYTDMRKLITALREICDKAENDGFHKVLYKFKRAVNDLSDISSDLEEFYEDNSIKESEDEEPIEAIGFKIYITYEDEPGVYHSELYKEEYTEDIDRADDIVAELRAQGLHASSEIIWNKEEDPNYDKDVDETNYAAEEEADAIDRLENKYGRVDEAEDNSSDEYNKMKEIYTMDRVIRALNDEDALYDYGWLYYVEDESTDRGFEYFYEENKSDGDWKNTYTTPFKHADGSEDEPVYEICKRLFKEILNEPDIAEAGILTRHWFDTHGGRSQWKTLSGATPEEVEFAKSINPNIKVID